MLTVLYSGFAVRAQTPPITPKPEEKKPVPVGELPLPADSIIILCEKASEMLRAMPNAVVLPPAKYQELLDEIERLKRQAQAQKNVAITKCALSGKVEGNRVELLAKFSFVTERDRIIVPLGCSLGQPTAITLDGKSPLTWNGPEGVTIQVDKKGTHEVEINLELAVTKRAPDPRERPSEGTPSLVQQSGFELDLPLCAITTLALDLPANLKDLRLNDAPVQEPLEFKNNQLAGPLNRPTRLKLSWRRVQAAQAEAILLSADGRITVRMQPAHAAIEAELTLKALGAPVQQWKLLVPPTAEVKLASASDEARLQGPIQGNDGKGSTRTIVLKEASTEPLVVIVQQRQPHRGTSLPLGPFVVQGATRQRGSIFITAPTDQRVRHRLPRSKPNDPLPIVETSLRTPTEDERKLYAGLVLTLAYWNLSSGEKGDERTPWLELEQEPIQGVLATRLLHTLRVTPAPPTSGARWEWRLTTTIDGLPIRNGVEEMRLFWPTPWRMDEERGPRPVDWAHGYRTLLEGKDSVTRFELPRESLKPFQLVVESTPYRIAEVEEGASGDLHSALLPLPRTQAGRDRGNHLVTIVGTEEIDLSIAQPSNPPLELVTQDAGKIVWRAERLPGQVAIAWKPFRADLAVTSTVDVHLEGTRGTLLQKIRFLRPASAPRQLLLRVPESVADRIEVVRGGQLSGGLRIPGSIYRLLRVERPSSASDGEVVLASSFALTAPGTANESIIPLAIPQQATQGTIVTRVWAEPGGRVSVVGNSPWQESPLEIVAEEDRLPALVLRGTRPDLPLALRYDRPASALGRLVIDRALVQVQVLDGGFQRYRIRLAVREPSSQPLELQFPAPLATLDLQMLLDGKRLDTWEGVDDSGKVVGDSGRTARIRLAQVRKSSILEISYQLVPGRTGGSGNLTSVLQPTAIPALPTGVPTRWQVELPEDWVPLPLEGAGASWKWGWRGWLLAPRPALENRDLERWLAGDEAADQLPGEYGDSSCSLVCWRSDLTPLTIYHVPQAVSLLVCSVGVLCLGLALVTGLTNPSQSRSDPTSIPARVWLLLGAILLGLILLGVFTPGLFAVLVYGSQPGLIVLIVVVVVQWLIHERQRRQLVYLPGFSRRAPGSSLVQPRGGRSSNGTAEPAPGTRSTTDHPALPAVREPTTVDAPSPQGSS